MPQLNPFYESLRGIDDKYRDLIQRAKQSRVPPYGEARYSKREARVRFMREWAVKTREQREAELAIPGRAEEILELVGGA